MKEKKVEKIRKLLKRILIELDGEDLRIGILYLLGCTDTEIEIENHRVSKWIENLIQETFSEEEIQEGIFYSVQEELIRLIKKSNKKIIGGELCI